MLASPFHAFPKGPKIQISRHIISEQIYLRDLNRRDPLKICSFTQKSASIISYKLPTDCFKFYFIDFEGEKMASGKVDTLPRNRNYSLEQLFWDYTLGKSSFSL